MNIIYRDNPAVEAGKYLSKLIADHPGDTLCLLSGGSALDVIEFVTQPSNPELRTIFMLGDERWSRAGTINNYLQLQTRYPAHWVSAATQATIPNEGESLEQFSLRLNEQLEKLISEPDNLQVIYLLGVGTDGHTAGIFPLPELEFANIYERDLSIVPVHLKGLTIDSRASITPAWVRKHVDHVIGYVVGVEKQLILESLQCEVKPMNQRPAELLRRFEATVYTDVPTTVCR